MLYCIHNRYFIADFISLKIAYSFILSDIRMTESHTYGICSVFNTVITSEKSFTKSRIIHYSILHADNNFSILITMSICLQSGTDLPIHVRFRYKSVVHHHLIHLDVSITVFWPGCLVLACFAESTVQ